MSKYIDMFGAIQYQSSGDLINDFMAKLPTTPPPQGLENECPMWVKGDTILCKTEWLAYIISEMLDHMCGGQVSHIGYYDPEEDERGEEVDEMTGWWYVDFD